MEQIEALELESLAAGARDSLTDEMVSRLSATAADGRDLLDKVNRSGVAGALPALAQLVANGDLDPARAHLWRRARRRDRRRRRWRSPCPSSTSCTAGAWTALSALWSG